MFVQCIANKHVHLGVMHVRLVSCMHSDGEGLLACHSEALSKTDCSASTSYTTGSHLWPSVAAASNHTASHTSSMSR